MEVPTLDAVLPVCASYPTSEEPSDHVLIFCSKGYFQSKNCMRELVSSTLKGKPVIALIDPDGSPEPVEVGEDPDKRDYIVSNQRLLDTGFETEWDLDRGITELIKGYTIIRNTIYSNV